MEKIKVSEIEIIVTGKKEKPYFEIKYREVGKRHYNIGFSSYNLDYVDKFYPNSPYAPKVSWKKMMSYEKIKGNPAVCQTTVPMAVSCFVNSNTFEDCVWKAVQFGWDTDTQAAIAGSIAGTYYIMHCLFSDDSNNAWKTLKENKYIKEIIT